MTKSSLPPQIFNAMRTRRPYRNPVDPRTIVRRMPDLSGSDSHPLPARNFLNILKLYGRRAPFLIPLSPS